MNIKKKSDLAFIAAILTTILTLIIAGFTEHRIIFIIYLVATIIILYGLFSRS